MLFLGGAVLTREMQWSVALEVLHSTSETVNGI